MAKNYKVVFQATIDTAQLQKEAQKALQGTSIPFNTKGMTSYGAAAKQSAGMLGEFNAQLKNLGSTIPKVAAFGVATAAIGLFTSGVRSAIDQVFELDAAVTEFRKVSDLSGEALDDYTDKLANLGSEVARTKSEMVSAATEFKKSGYDEEDSAMLAQIAAMYQNIADEQIDAGESASFIIAQMKAFNITAEDSMHIIDAVNAVSNTFAVSSADLATNLGKVSSTLAITGTSFEESLGMLTAITEITRNASTASRGLKQISSRLTQTLDESSSTGQKLKEIYSDLGISLVDEEGQIRSTYDILKDLAAQWDSLSTNQQEYIALTSAGSNQVQNFTALLGNFNQAVKATETAEKSAGSATKENAAYMESLEARLQGLRAEWQNLTTEGGVINNFIKLVLSAGTAILKFANNDVVKFTVKIAAFTAGIYLAVKAVVALSGALWSLALNNPVLLGIAAITAGAIGLSKAIKTDQERFDELKETLQETNDALSQTQSEYDALASKAPTELTNAEKERLEILKEQLEILREQRKVQQEELKQAYKAPTVAVTKKAPAGTTESIGGGLGFRFVDTVEVQESVEDYIKTLGKLTDADDKAREAMAAHAEQLNEFKEYGIQLNKSQQEFLKTYNALITANNLATESYKKYGDTIGNLVEKELDKLAKSYGKNKQALADFLKTQDAESISLLAAKQAAVDFINANGAKQVSINNTSKSLRQEIDAMIKETEVERARVSATLEAEAKIAGARAAAASGYAKGSEAYARTIGQYVTSAKLADSSYTNLTKSLNEMYSIRSALNIVEYQNTSITNNNTSATSSNTSSKKENTDAEKELKDAVSETTNALKEQAQQIENAADLMISRLDDEIDLLENQKKALEGTNKELEDQLELQEALDALAKAKSRRVLVYQGGQFTYSADASAIGEAQQRVDEIRRKQAQQAQLDDIDKQISALKAEQDTWRDVKNAYNEYLGVQELGVSIEGNAWKQRIGQAKEYAQEYIKIMGAMKGVESGAISLSEGQNILSSSGVNKKATTALDKLPQGFVRNALLQKFVTDVNPVSKAYDVAQNGTNISIANVSLPNVTDADSFVSELEHFNYHAKQTATQR